MEEDFKKRLCESFVGFVEIVARLRDPEKGCPWDLKQDHSSLRPFMIEEAYEAAEAMASGDIAHIKEELGDVLLQVVLNAQLMTDAGTGSVVDVLQGISEKMVRRHPHVFDESVGERSVDEVKYHWEKIKAEEKPQKALEGVFAKLRSSPFPAMMHGVKIGKKAKVINFDWSSPHEVLAKVKEELAELEQEMADEASPEKRLEEFGDLLFSVAQLARHLRIDPELAAAQGNQKFLKRFAAMEELAHDREHALKDLSQEEMEGLWEEAKKKGF